VTLYSIASHLEYFSPSLHHYTNLFTTKYHHLQLLASFAPLHKGGSIRDLNHLSSTDATGGAYLSATEYFMTSIILLFPHLLSFFMVHPQSVYKT